MSTLEILNDFKSQLITFFDELIEQFPSEPDIVIARLFITNQLDMKKAIEGFINTLNKDNNMIRNCIKQKNEEFFTKYNLFGSIINNEKFNHFSRIWNSNEIDDDDKEVIWNWVNAFVFLSDKYTESLKL